MTADTPDDATDRAPDDAVVRSWPDLAGRLEGHGPNRRHVLPIRVYFEDTDFSGLVYHASYIRWCERGRSDFLRLIGNDHRGLIEGADREPAAFVVRRLTIDYFKPARIDDVLEVSTRIKARGAATLTLDQRVSLVTDGKVVELVEAEVMVVLVSQAGRVLRLSKFLTNALDNG